MKIFGLILYLFFATLSFAEKGSVKLYTIVPGADVILQDAYGVMLINDGDSDKPMPRYILGVRKTGKVIDTRDINVFSKALSGIPKGSILHEYDSCSAPRAFGLTSKQTNAFYRVIKARGLRVSDDTRIT